MSAKKIKGKVIFDLRPNHLFDIFSLVLVGIIVACLSVLISTLVLSVDMNDAVIGSLYLLVFPFTLAVAISSNYFLKRLIITDKEIIKYTYYLFDEQIERLNISDITFISFKIDNFNKNRIEGFEIVQMDEEIFRFIHLNFFDFGELPLFKAVAKFRELNPNIEKGISTLVIE